MSALLDKTKTLAKITGRLKGDGIGDHIDTLWELREEKRKAEDAVKIIDAKISAQEEIVMERLDAEGIGKADGKKGSVSIQSAVVANVTDWDALWAYASKNKFFHLFQKRVSDPAWRELMGKNGKKGVPGTEAFTKKKILLRSIP